MPLHPSIRSADANHRKAYGTAELAQAFEADALERAFSMELIWQASARHEHEAALVKFVQEDPACNVSFTGLDRSNIQASPDWIVDDGVGFSVFGKSTKAGRQPSRGLGPQPGPATMSYGRAISNFGLPEPPGAGPSSESSAVSSEQLPAVSEDAIIATQLSKCHLGRAKKAITEGELRLARGDSPPTRSRYKEGSQWAVFGAGKFITTAESSTDAAATAPAPASTAFAVDKETGLPAVEGHDYNGLTNWLCRCLISHKDFLRVTQRWDKERNTRNERVAAKIRAWTPPMDFEDGGLGQPDPRDFYNGTPLGEVDQAKLGIKTKVTTG
ncbi:unnamed protein product [Alternaria alternata]